MFDHLEQKQCLVKIFNNMWHVYTNRSHKNKRGTQSENMMKFKFGTNEERKVLKYLYRYIYKDTHIHLKSFLIQSSRSYKKVAKTGKSWYQNYTLNPGKGLFLLKCSSSYRIGGGELQVRKDWPLLKMLCKTKKVNFLLPVTLVQKSTKKEN